MVNVSEGRGYAHTRTVQVYSACECFRREGSEGKGMLTPVQYKLTVHVNGSEGKGMLTPVQYKCTVHVNGSEGKGMLTPVQYKCTVHVNVLKGGGMLTLYSTSVQCM
eukprot:TRINITY_DN106922_c0_g1_i3.p2 TRINITY_DN106922_c0_g1~~TRINITY_DN106922_c0_g1_i3.p2  ORF type:complete len:107 (-),score=10.42 TRINITY_DN106922_c0_g1_i3:152-472(-)